MQKPNKTLKGHKLVVLFGLTGPPKIIQGTVFPEDWIAELTSLFPDLKVANINGVTWGTDDFQSKFPDKEWKDATIVVTGSALPTPELAPNLEYVQIQIAGANHMLKNRMITETNVKLCNASGIHGTQIAEWVVATFLSFRHHLLQYNSLQSQARWHKLGNGAQDSVGQRIGILGYGAVGRQVARVFKALGMDIHACTLRPRETEESRKDDTYVTPGCGDPDGILPSKWFSANSKAGLHEFLLSGLDILVLTIPLTSKTQGIIGQEELQLLSAKRTFISNVARGEVIDTDALIESLEKDLICGAALDVTDPEPLPDGHRLWSTKNVIITPHVSGDSEAYARRVFEVLKHNLVRLSKGEELSNQVDRVSGY